MVSNHNSMSPCLAVLLVNRFYLIIITDAKGAELAPGLLKKAEEKGCKIVLPCDWLCGQDFCNDQETKLVTQEEGIPEGWEGMDCGPKSMELFRKTVLESATVIWNGPGESY